MTTSDAPPGRVAPATSELSAADLLAELQLLRAENSRLREAANLARHEQVRLRAVLDTIPAGVAILHANGTVLQVNEVYSRIWRGSNPSLPLPGSVEETAAYVAWWADTGKLIEPQEWASSRALEGKTSIGEVIEIQRFDGSRGTIINSAAPLYDSEGNCDGAVVALLDITARKLAEDELRASEERYRSLFNCMSEGFALHEIICNESGEPCDYRFLDVNPAFEHLTGLRREQVIGRLKTEVLPGDDFHWIRIYGRVALTGEPIHFDSRSTALDRHYDVFSFRPAPMQFAVVFVDVTDHKRLEQSLRDADRRKNEFLATLSHELRNPLAPIRNGLRIMERAEPTSQQFQRSLTIVGRQVDHLTRLVDELLDVTRVTRGRVELRLTRVELGQLLREVAEDMQCLFDERQVELTLLLPAGNVFVQGDRTRLTQVVGNLLHNAARFTAAGGHARIELHAIHDQGVARFAVKDDGKGLSAELLPLLFEPFSQMDRSLERSQGGLGLGLALVRGLVELHGGTIVARSAGVGCGAEFTVTLPLALAEPATATVEDEPAHTRARRILVVEDNVDAADSLRDLLELEGHQVRVALEGGSALAVARDFKPEIVLCDIGLPGMDGYAIARAFRQDESLRSCHLVALSGYALPEDRRRGREAGFAHHLAKPVEYITLRTLLATLD